MILRNALLLARPLRDVRPAVLVTLILGYLLRSMLPAATALATAALIAHVDGNGLGPVVVPLLILGFVIMADQGLGAVFEPVEFLACGQMDGAHRARVARLATGAQTVAVLERPEVQDLLRTAAADPVTWAEQKPSDGAVVQLHRPIRYLGMAAAAAILAGYAWWLVPALVIPALLNRLHLLHVTRRHYVIWQAQAPTERRFTYWGRVATSLAEGKELRVFGLGDWLVNRYRTLVRRYLEPVYADERRQNLQKWRTAVLIFVPISFVYYVVARGTADGRATIATETAVLTAAWAVYTAAFWTYDAVKIAGARVVMRAYEQVRELLPAPAQTATKDADGGPPPLVRFEGVSFGYEGADRLVLDRLDLELRPGEMLAVVGLNGAGKSTMTKLLAGLYEPTAGRITADGVDIADPATGGIPGWRRRLAIVFQDFVRYHLPARDNVRLGHGGALDGAALQQAAEESGALRLVEELPDGWDTPLARDRTGGVDLSGGQWQQVALARALYAVYRGARVLVLDEPTAHLDVRTEFDVFERLMRARGNATVVLISHRLSTVRQADRIVLLDGGRVVEDGTHDSLIERDGRYAEMFALQAERFTRGYDDRIEEMEG
ncbi:ABC transporter ATP-binding protein [Luedemannella helvata]|uniref:ABC transporter ATP-binding protein n=1 Tax=Luedemannella helvata TaxID=349315 RepID=A0ABN2KJ66_9ACTN